MVIRSVMRLAWRQFSKASTQVDLLPIPYTVVSFLPHPLNNVADFHRIALGEAYSYTLRCFWFSIYMEESISYRVEDLQLHLKNTTGTSEFRCFPSRTFARNFKEFLYQFCRLLILLRPVTVAFFHPHRQWKRHNINNVTVVWLWLPTLATVTTHISTDCPWKRAFATRLLQGARLWKHVQLYHRL